MRISVSIAALRRIRPSALVWRFALGGAITATAGLIAQLYGPSIGGLFLAFPAILPMTLTLLDEDQRRRKARLHLHGVVRGRQAAALDAFGAVIGAAGLFAFALSLWWLTAHEYRVSALVAATIVWLVVSTSLWWLRKRRRRIR